MIRGASRQGKASPALVNEILEVAEQKVKARRANISLDPKIAASLVEAVRRSKTKSLIISIDKAVEIFRLPSEYNDSDRADVLATSLGRRLRRLGLRVGTAESGRYLRFALSMA